MRYWEDEKPLDTALITQIHFDKYIINQIILRNISALTVIAWIKIWVRYVGLRIPDPTVVGFDSSYLAFNKRIICIYQ